jgi:hypothetical protein
MLLDALCVAATRCMHNTFEKQGSVFWPHPCNVTGQRRGHTATHLDGEHYD